MSGHKIRLPAIWLLALMGGLPQFAETVTPSLPDIAAALRTSGSMAEYTLTVYLIGFAIGTLFWGQLSDKLGRKPCVLAGLAIFIVGCAGCYFSSTIGMLMSYRFIQAFGGSIGSVLGHAICRDAYHGPALGKAYASIVIAMAVFSAIGPVIGGLIAQYLDWPSIFLFLILCAMALSIVLAWRLPETHRADNRKPVSIIEVMLSLVKNKKVIGLALIVGACNGIMFSYFAEGPFYFIELLALSPRQYGLSFLAISISSMLGGMVSKKLHKTHKPETIMGYGLTIVLMASLASSILVLTHNYILALPTTGVVILSLAAQMAIVFGVPMVIGNAHALALVDYKSCIGTASSLFGSFYYVLTAFCTLGMGYLHNDTLVVMPLYFLGLSVFMLIIQQWIKKTIA